MPLKIATVLLHKRTSRRPLKAVEKPAVLLQATINRRHFHGWNGLRIGQDGWNGDADAWARREGLQGAGWAVYFRQDRACSRAIHTNFHLNPAKAAAVQAKGRKQVNPRLLTDTVSWLFPPEEIADAARAVKQSRTVSRAAAEEYGPDCLTALARQGVELSDEPPWALTESRRRQLQEQYRGRPYGDVRLTSRLVYIPQ